MDTLVGISTIVAFIYSFAVTAFEKSLAPYLDVTSNFYDVVIVVIGLIALGQALEARAKKKTNEALQKLAGVGRKTASVWLNCARGWPTIAVDTHVFRVSNRLGLCKTKTPDATELALEKVIPKEFLQHAHHWLILHGRYVCKARKPECERCAVRPWCEFKEKTTQ